VWWSGGNGPDTYPGHMYATKFNRECYMRTAAAAYTMLCLPASLITDETNEMLTSSLPWFLRRSNHSKISLCHGSRYTAKAPLRLPPPWSTYLHYHQYEHKQHTSIVKRAWCNPSTMVYTPTWLLVQGQLVHTSVANCFCCKAAAERLNRGESMCLPLQVCKITFVARLKLKAK